MEIFCGEEEGGGKGGGRGGEGRREEGGREGREGRRREGRRRGGERERQGGGEVNENHISKWIMIMSVLVGVCVLRGVELQ